MVGFASFHMLQTMIRDLQAIIVVFY